MSWFLGTMAARGEARRRARLLVGFGLAFGAYCACFVPILFFVSAPEAALWTAFTSTVMLLSPFVMRWRRSIPLASGVLVSGVAGLFIGTSVTLGGLSSPTTPCLAIAPIVALFLMGRRAGVLWSLLVTAVVGVLYGLDQTDNSLPLLVDELALLFLKFAGFITLMAVCLIFLLEYDKAQGSALRKTSRANRRMTQMIAHLEDTSTALRKSAAELAGRDPGAGGITGDRVATDAYSFDGVGLIQQMMSAASSGRSMIGGVDESIRGMIDQYKLISQRIGDLYEQSGVIVEMVGTIDSISNRLDLLALNTGIEAEHAGSTGQSFKLLATDMRRLAERVMTETSRIKSVIEQVQRHTTAAIEASRTGQILTDEGSTKLDAMSSEFDNIYQLVEQAATASEQITGDTVVQLATIYDLVNASIRAQDEID